MTSQLSATNIAESKRKPSGQLMKLSLAAICVVFLASFPFFAGETRYLAFMIEIVCLLFYTVKKQQFLVYNRQSG